MHTPVTFVQTRQAGLSLIELMISLSLGLVVMLGAAQIFVSANLAYSETQRFAQLQGDISLTSDLLAADVQAATSVSQVDDANGNSILTLTVGAQNVVYTLASGVLTRTVGGVAEAISEQVASFKGQCIAKDMGHSCASPLMVRLALGINSTNGSDNRIHLLEFNVSVRNNVLAVKFSS
ncbi:MAG: PilW family protein [Shewanella sp.]